jgi:hypothetical protein
MMWFRRIVNAVLLVAMIAAPTALVSFVGWSAAIMSLISLALALIFVNVDAGTITEVSLGPLKARLERRIAEADALTQRLRESIKLTLAVAVSATMRTGRYPDRNRMYVRDALDRVDQIAKSAGLTSSDLAIVKDDFRRFTEIDMAQAFLSNYVFTDPTLEAIASPIRHGEKKGLDIIPGLRELVCLTGAGGPEIEEWIADYEQFVKTGILRRPKEWFSLEVPLQGLIRDAAKKGS